MKQLVIQQELQIGQNFILENEVFHYLKHVRRFKIEDELAFLCPSGNRFQGKLTKTEEDHLVFHIVSLLRNENKENFSLTLFQCLPKGKKMEQIIRQAAEAGIEKLVPVQSEFSIPRFESARDFQKKQERWQKIAQEAAQQSGSSRVLQVGELTSISNIHSDDDLKLFAHPDDEALSLHGHLLNEIQRIALLIGPEGGLSPGDLLTLDRAGFLPVYLGQSILRTENAGLFFIGAVKMILLEKESWRAS